MPTERALLEGVPIYLSKIGYLHGRLHLLADSLVERERAVELVVDRGVRIADEELAELAPRDVKLALVLNDLRRLA